MKRYYYIGLNIHKKIIAYCVKAITAAKKKNDRADAEKIADLLRVNLLPVPSRESL